MKQHLALDGDTLIHPHMAEKNKKYRCPHCKDFLILRESRYGVKHFFHLKTQRSCRQNSINLSHLYTQLAIYSQLPIGEKRLEKPFPVINRVGDVVWEKEKIVFEIQCSPILLTEARDRIEDYASEGYQVVWILHERSFNKDRVLAAESYLRKRQTYYSNIKPSGFGFIYDQFEIVKYNERLYKSAPFPIRAQLSTPNAQISIPDFLKSRLAFSNRIFQGDLIWQMAYHPQRLGHFFLQLDENPPPKKQRRNFKKFLSEIVHRALASFTQ